MATCRSAYRHNQTLIVGLELFQRFLSLCEWFGQVETLIEELAPSQNVGLQQGLIFFV